MSARTGRRKPHHKTIYSELLAECLVLNCQCEYDPSNSHRWILKHAIPRHTSTCPYTPNYAFSDVDASRELGVRTFLNTLIVSTLPTPTPAADPKRCPSKNGKGKSLSFDASVKTYDASRTSKMSWAYSWSDWKSNSQGPRLETSNTTAEKQPPPPHTRLRAERTRLKQLILCNGPRTNCRLPLCICSLTDNVWETYLLKLNLHFSITNPKLTTWIPLLNTLNRAIKLWVSKNVLQLGGWESSYKAFMKTSTPARSSNNWKEVQSQRFKSDRFLALREQIHLSHALAGLVDPNSNSARAIAYGLFKLKIALSYAEFRAREMMPRDVAVKRDALKPVAGIKFPPPPPRGTKRTQIQPEPGPIGESEEEFQRMTVIPSEKELDIAKKSYWKWEGEITHLVKKLKNDVGGLKDELNKQLGGGQLVSSRSDLTQGPLPPRRRSRHVSIPEPSEPGVGTEEDIISDKTDATHRYRSVIKRAKQRAPETEELWPGTEVWRLERAFREIPAEDFADYWPVNSKRKVDFVLEILTLVHGAVVKLEEEVKDIEEKLQAAKYMCGRLDKKMVLGMSIEPVLEKVERLYEAVRGNIDVEGSWT
ncbi:hypothetical protein V8F20_011619 [Naviculisporaceae sp. PSN 640]